MAGAMVGEAARRCAVRTGVLTGLTGTTGEDADSRDSKNEEDEKDAAEVTTDTSEESNPKHRRRKRTRKSLLNQESKRRIQIMDRPLPYDSNYIPQQTLPLDSLVVPDSAGEIVAVVSALAKCYAQRLVAAARRVADAEDEARALQRVHDDVNEQTHDKEESIENAPSEATATATADNPDAFSQTEKSIRPLQPHHYREAHRHRVEAGIDPGFWMLDMISKVKKIGREQSQQSKTQSKSSGVAHAAAVGRRSWNSSYLAALAAQDAYDEMMREEEGKEEDVNKEGKDKNEKGEEQKMDVEKE